jgi:DUF2934 family protein
MLDCMTLLASTESNRDNRTPPFPEEYATMAREKTPISPPPRKRASTATATKKSRAAQGGPKSATLTPFLGPGERVALIAEAAYFRAEKRGFAAGREMEDWIAAEAEVDAKLMKADSASRA